MSQQFHPRTQGVGPVMLRYGLYTAAVAAISLLAGHYALVGNGVVESDYRERGVIETSQTIIVALASLLLFLKGWRHPEQRALMASMGFLAALAVVRELDSELIVLIPKLGWKLPAAFLLAGCIAVIVRDACGWGQAFERWLPTAAAGMLWAGSVTVILYAQILGQSEIWAGLLGEADYRHTKRVVEESAELFGYTLILLGAVETWFIPRLNQSPAPSTPSP